MKPEILEWLIFVAWFALAIWAGLSKLRLRFAGPLTAVAMIPPLAYSAHLHGLLEMGGLMHICCGAFVPFMVRRLRELFSRPAKALHSQPRKG